jgi:hypothetical protein
MSCIRGTDYVKKLDTFLSFSSFAWLKGSQFEIQNHLKENIHSIGS